jgi:hypothetical protein
MPNPSQQSTAFRNVGEVAGEDAPRAISELKERQEVQRDLSDCQLDPEPSEKAVLPLWTPTFFRIARKNRGMLPLSLTPLLSNYKERPDGLEGQSRSGEIENYSNAYARLFP